MERDLQMRFRVRRRRLFTFLIALFDAGKPRHGCAAVKKNSSFADLLFDTISGAAGVARTPLRALPERFCD